MSRLRLGAGLSVGITCIFLFLLLPLANPVTVEARWNPRIGNGIPKDPGTPFEEPEERVPAGVGDSQAGPCSIKGGARPVAPIAVDVTGPATRAVRRIVLQHLVLVLWHLQ